MKAIIPTAGFGTRLRPFTYSVPKVLLQVADKPILGHIIDKCLATGIDEIAFVVGYLGDAIKKYIAGEYPALRTHFVQQPKARGLGHAVYLALDLFKDEPDPVLIILGDTIIDADLSVLGGAGRGLIGVCEVEDARRFGVVVLEGDTIVRMVEKADPPPSNLAIVGVYYITDAGALHAALDANIQEGILTKGEIQLTDALQRLVANGADMGTFPVKGWHDCGSPELLLETNQTFLAKRFAQGADELEARLSGVRVQPPVYVAPSAQVTDSVIGPNVSIGENAVVEGCVLRDSIVNRGAEVCHAVLAGSIVGNDARLIRRPLRVYLGDTSEAALD